MVVVVVGVVVGLVVVVLSWVRPQDPLAFQWDVGLVDSGGGFRGGLGCDRGRGVPLPVVRLAGGGGGFQGVDDGVLGDGNVNEDLEGVVLCVCLCGGNSC